MSGWWIRVIGVAAPIANCADFYDGRDYDFIRRGSVQRFDRLRTFLSKIHVPTVRKMPAGVFDLEKSSERLLF